MNSEAYQAHISGKRFFNNCNWENAYKISSQIKNIGLIIDLGCGRGVIGALVRIYRNPKRLVGIDIFHVSVGL